MLVEEVRFLARYWPVDGIPLLHKSKDENCVVKGRPIKDNHVLFMQGLQDPVSLFSLI